MASRSVAYEKVKSISPMVESWVVRVLLSQMWAVHDEFGDKDCIVVDMLLIDSDGCKILEKVYKMLFTHFLSDMFEGGVYVLRNFNVVPNNGSNKATSHPFMIVFQRKTMVTGTEPDVLHTIGLSPLTAAVVREIQFYDKFLVDTDWMLTGVSTEKEYVTTGVVHRFITLEDDFLVINPARKIVELEKTEHGRFSIVWAKVMSIIDRTSWWILHCKCGAVLSVINGLFCCDMCNKRVVNPVPKYRLRVQVVDEQEVTHFVLLDDDVRYLVRKSCGVLLDEIQLSMAMMFKVENYYLLLDGVECYPVRRVCDDIDIMRMFQRMNRLVAPQQVENWYRFAPLISSFNLQEQLEAPSELMTGIGPSYGVADSVNVCAVVVGDLVGIPTPV
ncbi:Nucleic acid-binding, OB-fold [Sesbania bispinosa]|nr:Nucleic acid-binding, OB-fold [Sesbania bispinosa]